MHSEIQLLLVSSSIMSTPGIVSHLIIQKNEIRRVVLGIRQILSDFNISVTVADRN